MANMVTSGSAQRSAPTGQSGDATDSVLEVRELRKRYIADTGTVAAVNGVSIEARAGEFVTLLGPSGCGKTTTLRCVAGLEVPDGGQITIGSQVAYSDQSRRVVPIERRPIGMVFQSYAIWPHMNVFQNVSFPLRIARPRIPKAEIAQRVRHALELVRMADYADRPVPRLSGGQQQRVALARALVRRPPLLLLDEPLSNLDAKLRIEMRDELVSIVRSTGVAVIYVTHDQVEALAMSDRIVVMHAGTVAQQGSPTEIYSSPATEFVAQFMGESNQFPGEVVAVEGEQTVVHTAVGPIRCRATGALTVGQAASVFTHLEDTEVLAAAPAAGDNVLEADVARVVYLGDRLVATLTSGETTVQATLRPQTGISLGGRVQVRVDPERSVAVAGRD